MVKFLVMLLCCDIYSTGPDGIESVNVPATGDRVLIGELGPARIGLPGFDDPAFCNSAVVPYDIFHGQSPGIQNQNIVDAVGVGNFDTDHATKVAGIMISQDSFSGTLGVAPGARLLSAGFDSSFPADSAIAANNLALNNCRAVNMSFGWNNGQILTDFVDWSARIQNVLYVVAQDESSGSGQIPDPLPDAPYPADNYNGMTVAALIQSTSGSGTWDQVALNMRQYDTRKGSICIAAPGDNLMVDELDDYADTVSSIYYGVGSSSYAAPHVTGTVALLNEAFSNNPDVKQHTVMKSVLMTSADVITGVLDSHKTAHTFLGKDWTQIKPNSSGLNPEYGAGLLNASRAYSLLRDGEHHPGIVNSDSGWDYTSVDQDGKNKYQFAMFTTAIGGWVDITLCWDRVVQIIGGDSYTSRDYTFDDGLNKPALTLSLMPLNSISTASPVASVTVGDDNTTAHIFRQVSAGKYEIWVTQTGGVPIVYGLSWLFGNGNSTGYIGDYNNDGVVGPQDYIAWSNNFGPGGYSAADYTVWRDHTNSTSLNASSVPEPCSLILFMGVLVLWSLSAK